jgi:hypothetical protein
MATKIDKIHAELGKLLPELEQQKAEVLDSLKGEYAERDALIAQIRALRRDPHRAALRAHAGPTEAPGRAHRALGRGAAQAHRLGFFAPAKMADGIFYNDLREPFIGADITAVTLATTAKALYPASNFPVLGGQYFSRIGKALRIRLFGRMTTAATPGNGSFNVYYGTGADANGTALMTGTPVALVANGTNLSWMAEIDVHCRSLGSAGTLFCTGFALFHVGLLLSTNAPMLLPASAPAVSGRST